MITQESPYVFIFDFDNTLIFTDDLKDYRDHLQERCFNKDADSSIYDYNFNYLLKKLFYNKKRIIYDEEYLLALKHQFVGSIFIVCTASYKEYCTFFLQKAYPNFAFNYILAHQQDASSKLNPKPILDILSQHNISDMSKVFMIGDSIIDALCANNIGCQFIFDMSSYLLNFINDTEHNKLFIRDKIQTLMCMSDIVLPLYIELKNVIVSYKEHLPILEALIALSCDVEAIKQPRFLKRKVAYTDNNEYTAKNNNFCIVYSAARYFSHKMKEFSYRAIQEQILNFKHYAYDTKVTPFNLLAFMLSLLLFIKFIVKRQKIILTSIPDKIGSVRFKGFFYNLKVFLQKYSYDFFNKNYDIVIVENLFTITDNTQAMHTLHMNKDERIAYVKEHMLLNQTNVIDDFTYIVIDDVITTGASLAYAHELLRSLNISASNIFLFSLAQTQRMKNDYD